MGYIHKSLVCNLLPKLFAMRLTSFLLLAGLLACSSMAFAQTTGPLGATRWTGGASWNPDGSIDDAPNAGPVNGVIRCGSAAETQSQIGSSGVYDPSVFEVVMANNNCIEPSTGNTVTVSTPTVGEPVIWLNFDVRPYAGSFEIQINDNSAMTSLGHSIHPMRQRQERRRAH